MPLSYPAGNGQRGRGSPSFLLNAPSPSPAASYLLRLLKSILLQPEGTSGAPWSGGQVTPVTTQNGTFGRHQLHEDILDYPKSIAQMSRDYPGKF